MFKFDSFTNDDSEPPSRKMRIDDLRRDIMDLRIAQLDDRRLVSAPDAIQALTSLRVPQLLAPPSTGSAGM
jgi:hypothetical protein